MRNPSSNPAGSPQSCVTNPPPGTEKAFICAVICTCNAAPRSGKAGQKLKQGCVTFTLWAHDAACGFTSTIKAEVPFDMSQLPPIPIMSKNDKRRATRSKPKGSRAPDVIIVKDGSKPPTKGNIQEVIEIKFDDNWGPGQEADYKLIAGGAPLTELGPDECGCSRPKPTPVPILIPVPAPTPAPAKKPRFLLPNFQLPHLNPSYVAAGAIIALAILAVALAGPGGALVFATL
jgi:hypothetical protein